MDEEYKRITIHPTWRRGFTQEIAEYYFNEIGAEKGIYGMLDWMYNEIIYVGEGIDLTYRIWQHYHDHRFGGNLHLFHNSFYRTVNPHHKRPYTREEAEPVIKAVHGRYAPVLLWAQKGDDAEANGERFKQEILFMDKYKDTIVNDQRPDKKVKNKENRFTNEFGRYTI